MADALTMFDAAAKLAGEQLSAARAALDAGVEAIAASRERRGQTPYFSDPLCVKGQTSCAASAA